MKVLLLEDVDNLGLAGEVANVAPGYGRNYLIPQNLATLATRGALKQAESIRKTGELRRAQEKADAEAIANQIRGQTLVFERRVGERDRLYGSVTTTDIAKAIMDKIGLDIDKRKIRMAEPIRTVGQWNVPIRLMIEVTAEVKVIVIGEGQPLPQTVPDEAEADTEAVEEEAVVAEVDTEEAEAAA
jgi:large subunit ribosomal protein L9